MRLRIFVYILLVCLIGFAGYKLYPFFSSEKITPPTKRFDQGKTQAKQLFAVVVENLPESRPAYGLSQSDFVFETLTESGITRFLAFFEESKDVSKIGPVRSARPYFADFANGFHAMFAHSGGSREALAKIDALQDFGDLDEFYNEKYFWRDTSRKAPHNLFTSSKLLQDANFSKNFAPSSQVGWGFEAENKAMATSTISLIEIDFSYRSYFVTYKYDAASNTYGRFIAGKPDIDALTTTQIFAKNVVVLYTRSQVIDQKLLTIDLQTLGSGKALIFRDGTLTQARWKKDNNNSPLKLLEADDSLIKLNEGLTWFAVVDQNGVVTWE